MSTSDTNPPTDDDETSPDVTVEITNGKTIKVDFDKGEWTIIATFILLMTYLVGRFGWY